MAGTPAKAGGPSAALMASAKASIAAGLVAVSRAAAIASAGAPARPLLKCSVIRQWREPANKRVDKLRCAVGSQQRAGSQTDS